MANAAILIGNSKYNHLHPLDCCHDDLAAMKQLLEAAEKYETVTVIENADADSMKQQLRGAIDKVPSPNELFFYFTGHGHGHDGELYHCATDFDSERPNITGISTTELHTILRPANAALVVKVIDACYSGTRLVKSDDGLFRLPKDGFQHIVQMASCLDSQNSLTGDPLSLFTGKFREAVLRKPEGPVLYMDIVNALRDAFIGDENQTPHFVAQFTGREHFVDDAKKLDELRNSLESARAAAAPPVGPVAAIASAPQSLLERLRIAEAKVVTPKMMSAFVAKLFDELNAKISADDFAEFFDLERTEHADFEEPTTEQFIIRVLTGAKEKRADNFVTARYERKLRKPNALYGSMAWDWMNPNSIYDEDWYLRLNATMERAQLKITFTPKFANLQKVTLVVTCAPSLDICYIFEIATQHLLQDFGKYDPDGPEVSRRWWKCVWAEGHSTIVDQIAKKFSEIVRQQLERAERRLSGDKSADV
jgi:Caspase domain